jgi:RNA polymerase sigma-70 factor (ECF subfamily)
MNVKEIIDGCKKGNKNSHSLLYDKFAGKLYGISLRYIGKTAEAQDVLQDSMIKIFRNISSVKYTTEESFFSWMKRITVNTALNHIRDNFKNNKTESLLDIEYESITENEEYFSEYDELLEQISKEGLFKMIQDLPDGYRTIFNLYAIENYSHKEIAEQLDVSVSTSKTQLFKARRLLTSKINGILEKKLIMKVI